MSGRGEIVKQGGVGPGIVQQSRAGPSEDRFLTPFPARTEKKQGRKRKSEEINMQADQGATQQTRTEKKQGRKRKSEDIEMQVDQGATQQARTEKKQGRKRKSEEIEMQVDQERNGVEQSKAKRALACKQNIDSDEDKYYSSPEDEEEFVCQEFIKEYNSVQAARLQEMTKSDLVQEYLEIEQRVENLEKRLNQQSRATLNTQETIKEKDDQIRHYQQEILRLEAENEKLQAANEALSEQQSDNENEGSCSPCTTCSTYLLSTSESSESEDETQNDEVPLTTSRKVPLSTSTNEGNRRFSF